VGETFNASKWTHTTRTYSCAWNVDRAFQVCEHKLNKLALHYTRRRWHLNIPRPYGTFRARDLRCGVSAECGRLAFRSVPALQLVSRPVIGALTIRRLLLPRKLVPKQTTEACVRPGQGRGPRLAPPRPAPPCGGTADCTGRVRWTETTTCLTPQKQGKKFPVAERGNIISEAEWRAHADHHPVPSRPVAAIWNQGSPPAIVYALH
jgi:hypothetical protein